MKTKLTLAIETAESAGLVSYVDSNFRQRARRAYKRNLEDPGDCRGMDSMLLGLAIAPAAIGGHPGWIPQVQGLGCRIADKLEAAGIA